MPDTNLRLWIFVNRMDETVGWWWGGADGDNLCYLHFQKPMFKKLALPASWIISSLLCL